MFDDILTRRNEIVHITSSAFVVNESKDKVLMVHHNIFNSWSWTGGHADGDEDILHVAIKEVQEEHVSPHLHISIAFLMEADDNEPLVVKPDENSGVKWIPLNKVDSYCSEFHMNKIYQKILSKIVHL